MHETEFNEVLRKIYRTTSIKTVLFCKITKQNFQPSSNAVDIKLQCVTMARLRHSKIILHVTTSKTEIKSFTNLTKLSSGIEHAGKYTRINVVAATHRTTN